MAYINGIINTTILKISFPWHKQIRLQNSFVKNRILLTLIRGGCRKVRYRSSYCLTEDIPVVHNKKAFQ